ncbi:unnamed protein product [Ilex paraguariensis]|uniref:Uncharacterized protein n=1 Tax=Ilex paraguariensis TaxID=185542 RepID=A0ABC8R6D1_9AQUA
MKGNGTSKSSDEPCVLMDSSMKVSMSTQTRICENGKTIPKNSIVALNLGKVLEEENLVNSRGKPQKVETASGKGFQPSCGFEGATEKLMEAILVQN